MGVHEFIPVEECAVYTATCDTGECQRQTVALVKDPDLGWVSMCGQCTFWATRWSAVPA